MPHYCRLLIIAALMPFTATSFAAEPACGDFCHPFYYGATAGYGSTTWSGLVPDANNQNMAMTMSTPIRVGEGGIVWGLFVGYEFAPYFALEASYMRYPNARVHFDAESIFTFNSNGLSYFDTHTETVSVMGKIMLIIPRSKLRVYSSFGPAVVHRWDQLDDQQRVTPTFGLGVNYNITERVMAELGGSYTAGFGQSELNPANDYMPFLYAAFFGIAYRV